MDDFKLTRFHNQHKMFMVDYYNILKPLTQALDLIQGDKPAYLGIN